MCVSVYACAFCECVCVCVCEAGWKREEREMERDREKDNEGGDGRSEWVRQRVTEGWREKKRERWREREKEREEREGDYGHTQTEILAVWPVTHLKCKALGWTEPFRNKKKRGGRGGVYPHHVAVTASLRGLSGGFVEEGQTQTPTDNHTCYLHTQLHSTHRNENTHTQSLDHSHIQFCTENSNVWRNIPESVR